MKDGEPADRLEETLAAFGAYIEGCPRFDILYSKKAGYLYLYLEDFDAGMLLPTGEALLERIFGHIILDVAFKPGAPEREKEGVLTRAEQREVLERLDGVVRCGGERRAYYRRRMERYLKEESGWILE